MAITLPKESRKRLIEATKAYVRDEWDLDIGDLKAGLFADFVLQSYGPAIYNQAVREAQRHLAGVVSDLDLTLHEVED